MRVLDLCAGFGGFSAAFPRWEVVTVDNHPATHPDILGDVCRMSFDAGQFDVILASPPCVEYSRWGHPFQQALRTDPDLTVWKAVTRIISEVNPPVWVIENVRAAQQWHGEATIKAHPRYFWSSHKIPIPKSDKEVLQSVKDKIRSVEGGQMLYPELRYYARSYIQFEVSDAVYHFCKRLSA